jgi:hypothetical protein
MDTTEQKGNGTKIPEPEHSRCDRYPDDCPLIRRIRGDASKITTAEGSDAQIREYMKDPEKLWAAIDDLDKDLGVLTTRLETVIGDITRDVRNADAHHKIISLYERRVSRWQTTVLLITVIIGVLAFVGMSLYDHRFDGLWNSVQTTIGGTP